MIHLIGQSNWRGKATYQALQSYIRYIVFVVMAICTAVLLGWALNIELLKRVVPSFTAMNPFTALGFVATAAWLLLIVKWQQVERSGLRWACLLLAAFVLLTGILRGVDILWGTQYSWATWLTYDATRNQMSPPTAFGFTVWGLVMLIGIAKSRTKGNFALAVITVCIMALISLFGYMIGENHIMTMKPFKPMALHTTICFLALSVCFLMHYPRNAFTRQLISQNIGGITARRLLPFLIGVPFALGFLRYQGEQLGLYDTGFGVAILVVGAITIFTWVIWQQAKELNKIDKQRKAIERKIEERSKQLEALNQNLIQSNEELEQFAFVASHDLQEPLRKISMFSDILHQRGSHMTEQDRHYIEKMVFTSQRMSTLIKDLLHYSRLIHSKDAFVLVSIKDSIQNILHDFELVIQEKQVQIIVENLPSIEAIPFQINQLFYNLISNALKFTDPHRVPQISIICQELTSSEKATQPPLNSSLSYYRFKVADNGIGFDMSNQEKVFKMFQRLHSKEAYAGSGIGLAVCKKVALNHQGDILVESEEGVGTTFTVIIPKQQKA